MQGGGADVGVEILPLASFAWKPSVPRNAPVGNSPEQLLSTSEFALIICGSQYNLEISPEKYFGL